MNKWEVSPCRRGLIPRWTLWKLISSDFTGSRWEPYREHGRVKRFFIRKNAARYAATLNTLEEASRLAVYTSQQPTRQGGGE